MDENHKSFKDSANKVIDGSRNPTIRQLFERIRMRNSQHDEYNYMYGFFTELYRQMVRNFCFCPYISITFNGRMFGTFVKSKEMDWPDSDSDGDESDGDEPNGGGVEIRLQDVHYERKAAAHRQRAARRQIAARRQRAAAPEAAAGRFQRLEDQLKSLKVLLDGAVGSDGHKNETIKDYINRMIIEAYADIVERGSVKNESNKSPLIQQLNGSNWFKQLLKLQSILKEYLTAQYNDSCTPNEIEGLDIYWNKYPCSMRDGVNWLYTKKWDFYCSNKGRIDSEYVQNYIIRAEKFLTFLEPEASRQRAAGRRQKLAERQIAERRQRAAVEEHRQRAADRQIQDEKKWRRDEKRRNNERLRRNKQRRNKSNSYDEEYRDRDFNTIGGGDRKYGE